MLCGGLAVIGEYWTAEYQPCHSLERVENRVHSEAELSFTFNDDEPAYLGMYSFTKSDP